MGATRLASGKYAAMINSYCSPVKPFLYCSSWITPIARIFFARATCFNTTEMTDLTNFVSIACSLRYWPVTRTLGEIRLHRLCSKVPIRSNELIAKWACNAHKIRQFRHLRGAKARCEKIRAIGAIRVL